MESRYTREKLESLPVKMLETLEIKNQDEEKMVQEILDLKRASMPDPRPINATPEQTDKLTPEKEAELQAVLDKKNDEKHGITGEEEIVSEDTATEEDTPKKRGRKPKEVE